MKRSKVVIALGGNALGFTPSEQKAAVKKTAAVIVKLYLSNLDIVIVHGNGPQVGLINNAFMSLFKLKEAKEFMPFPECGAMSQGYIGYHIQNAIINELLRREVQGDVVTLVSQAVVDQNDPAFKNPSKPIGNFMSKEDALILAKQNNWTIKEDAGRGWRRVIASPLPQEMPALTSVKKLLRARTIVIVGGGGGIPVMRAKNKLMGVDAVIDKDATAAFVAKNIKADKLIILTAVNNVKINFGKKNEKSLTKLRLKDLNKYVKENHFAPGSMLPKIIAAKNFVKNTGKSAYIGALEEAEKIVQNLAGTEICK